jgi:hypothetical protein
MRLKKTHEPTTFDGVRAGHVIKLIVGLIQEYGALTVEEVILLLKGLNVDRSPSVVEAYLLCAKAVDWIVEQRKGSTTYYIARNLPDAATLILKKSASIRNKGRRRLLIRQYWKENDALRDRGIREVFGASRP